MDTVFVMMELETKNKMKDYPDKMEGWLLTFCKAFVQSNFKDSG